MITPFGTPVLFTVTTSKTTGIALRQFLDLFVGPSFPYYFPLESNLQVSSAEDLFYRLDQLEYRHLLNTVCVVDISEGGDRWNIHYDEGGLRPSELVLRYPEVYWIFLVDKVPENIKDINPVANQHFICVSSLLRVAQLLHHHACGFRSWFDATGFRKFLREPLHGEDAASTKRHSAPFRSQAIAGSLIQRAQSLSSEAQTSKAGIHAALLAHEAWEILEGETFTLSLEALVILHRMETLAECAFIGASADLPVSERIEEIHMAIESLKKNFISGSDNSSNGVQSSILTPLAETRFAAAIDEEESFLMLNGYVLYRYGYNVYVVPSLSEMKRIFGYCASDGIAEPDVEGISVVMEDLDLRFGDASHEMEEKLLIQASVAEDLKSGLRKRAEIFPGLRQIKESDRIIVSSTKVSGSISRPMSADMHSTVSEKDSVKLALTISKPYGGVFDAELVKRFENTSLYTRYKAGCNNAQVENWTYQKFNALSQIVDDLRQIYREFEQFDEEEKALSKVREYRWELKYRNKEMNSNSSNVPLLSSDSLLRKDIKGIKSAVELYFNWLMESICNIGAAILYWIFVFSFIYAGIDYVINHKISFCCALLKSGQQFFSMQPSDVLPLSGGVFQTFLFVQFIFAYSHLGIFIAYLYQKISRR